MSNMNEGVMRTAEQIVADVNADEALWMEERIVRVMGALRREGHFKPNAVRVNYDDFAKIIMRTGAKTDMVTTERDHNGWEQIFIKLHGAFGSIVVAPKAGIELNAMELEPAVTTREGSAS